MAQIKTEALVIREKQVGETDCLLTLLTRDAGLVIARANGARRPKSKLRAATELLTYGRFGLFERQDISFVDSAEPIETFFSLRTDVTKLALASYFAQVAYYLNLSASETNSYLRLILNCLYYLQTDEISQKALKALYELRGMTLAGFAPDLSCCGSCGFSGSSGSSENTDAKAEETQAHAAKNEAVPVWFSPKMGHLYCTACSTGVADCLPLSADLLAAMVHMTRAPLASLFRFEMGESVENALSVLAEQYLLCHLEHAPTTLDFYKSMK